MIFRLAKVLTFAKIIIAQLNKNYLKNLKDHVTYQQVMLNPGEN